MYSKREREVVIMTGTGTQSDPYIPSDWAELVTAAGEGEKYVKLPDGALWDLNDVYPEGAPTVEMYCNEIDGNGAEIRNVRCLGAVFAPGSYCLHNITIKNLKVINCYLTNATFFSGRTNSYIRLSLEDCEAAAELYGNSPFFDIDGCSISADQSSFRCHFAGNSRLNTADSGTLTLSNSRIDFTGESSAGGIIYYPVLNSSLITGEISGNSSYAVFADSSDASYIDCTFDGFSSVSYGGIKPVVINTDKTGSATVSSSFIQASSLQIRDIDWLHSHGFPCR